MFDHADGYGVFWAFWWLIFPIMFFAMGALSMVLRHRRHRDTLEVMKAYAAQGKDPAEVAKLLGLGGASSAPGADWNGFGHDMWAHRAGWRVWRRWSPYWQWSRFITLVCISGGFYLASRYVDTYGLTRAFTLVAIVTGILAVATGARALMASLFAPPADRHDG